MHACIPFLAISAVRQHQAYLLELLAPKICCIRRFQFLRLLHYDQHQRANAVVLRRRRQNRLVCRIRLWELAR